MSETKPEVTIDKSEVDGTWVVFVDTQEMPDNEKGPILRINLNDEQLWANPPFPGTENDGDYLP